MLYLKTIIKIGYKIKNQKVLNVIVGKKIKKKNIKLKIITSLRKMKKKL